MHSEWKDKLALLHSIFSDIEAIHFQGLVHRDLHSGNILQDNLYSAYIADLGLSVQYLKEQKKGEVCGVLPYIAPEVLIGNPHTTKSDIYALGIVMWEILYGMIVFCGKDHDIKLMREIFNGLRPFVNEEAPYCYVKLMEQCWDKDPEKRPSAEEIREIFEKWQNDEKILKELKESKPELEHGQQANIQTDTYTKSLRKSFPCIGSNETKQDQSLLIVTC
ncbi:kinase-like domain-containing protein [Gigaspora rosea]|uniref:Kinase-like domain-containing protein n=1 Tax=Gigaspora rosea TaxID=44941 RepID=A0A397US53_9GLOM|nr:kinase-like domain-containing protein [Gigaspora rosea]